MAGPEYQKHRKYKRYSLDVRARLSGGGQEISARTLDICEGGLGMVCPVEIAAGSLFTVKLVFPTVQGEFTAAVRAQNQSGFRFGFRFVEVDAENMALLRKFQRRWGIAAREDYAGTE